MNILLLQNDFHKNSCRESFSQELKIVYDNFVKSVQNCTQDFDEPLENAKFSIRNAYREIWKCHEDVTKG